MKLLTTLLILVAIAALSYGKKRSNAAPNHRNHRNHPINAKLGQSYVNYMVKTINPCSDFYRYSCGNWSKYHEPNQSKYRSVPELLNYEVNMEFIEYMNNTHMEDKPDFVKKAHEFYASCKGVRKFTGLPIIDWLEEHEIMKWILRMKTVDKNATFDWVHTLGLMRKYGMNNIFLNETLHTKESDPSQIIVELSKPRWEYGLRDYQAENLINNVELPDGVTYRSEFFEKIEELELYRKRLLHDDFKDKKDKQMMKVKNLPFSWLSKYLAVVLGVESLDTDMEITINNIGYIEALDNFLKRYDDEFLQRYLEVKILEYLHHNTLVDEELFCITSLRGLMPSAMHWIYDQMHPELKQEIPKIQQMFDNILKYVNKTLRSDKRGLVPNTFFAKLDEMQLKVGNLPTRQDTLKGLDALYANLSLTRTNYYGNYLQLMRHRFNIEHIFTTNYEFLDEIEANDLKHNVFPRYDPVTNVMIVPTYLLRPPIYHWAYGDLFKQSSLGSLMVHYVYSALQIAGFSEEDMKIIAGMGSVHNTYEMFFSTFVTENMSEHQSIVDMIDVSWKQMFFINAIQYYCPWDSDNWVVNLVMTSLPEFVDAFDCKIIHFRTLFKN